METKEETYKITTEYNLGGEKKYIVGYKQGNELDYYSFKVNDKIEIVNVLANIFKSKVYTAKDRGIERIFVMNYPHAYVYFV